MKLGSLFAGVGGFDLAAERAGMTVVWQSEVDRHASQVLAKHWPGVPNYGDIHNIRVRRTEPAGLARGRRDGADRSGLVGLHLSNDGDEHGIESPPAVDVLTGGFPCQDYSVAGLRGGLAGDRGALWWQFHRLIADLRPAWVVGENVPGLLSSNNGQDFGTIVTSLVELGYGVCWRVLDAQYFGVAQRRRRVFIVGHSGGVPRPEILFEPESCDGDSPPSRATGTRVAALTRNGVGGGGGPDDNAAQAGHLIPSNLQTDSEELGALAEPTDDMQAVRTPAVAFNPYRTMVERGEWVEGFKPDPVHDALTASRAPKGPPLVTEPTVRRLTPVECERLQGFPDGWTAGQSDTQRYRQMGNAVAVPVVEWIMRRIAGAS